MAGRCRVLWPGHLVGRLTYDGAARARVLGGSLARAMASLELLFQCGVEKLFSAAPTAWSLAFARYGVFGETHVLRVSVGPCARGRVVGGVYAAVVEF